MKKYVVEVTIYEGCDEFWEELQNEGKSGCDEIVDEIKNSIPLTYYNPEVKLKSFTDDGK